jgi:hypothetical protein
VVIYILNLTAHTGMKQMIDVIEISKLPLVEYKLVNANQEIVSVCFLNEYEASSKNYAYRMNKVSLVYEKMSTKDNEQTTPILILPN